MLDVEEDNEKLEDIMNEIFALHHPAFDWRDETGRTAQKELDSFLQKGIHERKHDHA